MIKYSLNQKESIKINKKIITLVIALSFLIFIFLSLKSIFLRPTLHIDEIFSIKASSNNWSILFKKYLIPDTHPPLYYPLLKIWIDFFGNSEISTRLLSLIPSIFTLIIFGREGMVKNKNNRIFSFLFILFNPSFFYYSQHVRNYSWMIFFASSTTILLLNLKNNSKFLNKKNHILYYLSLFLLSLSHYFGFIYALILEGFKYLEKPLRIQNKKSIFIYLILFLWPVIHRLTGMHLNRIKWIGELATYKPLLTNIEIFIRMLFPFIPPFTNLVVGQLILISIIFFGFTFLIFKIKPNIINYINKKRIRNKLNKKDILFEEVFFLTKILISFLLILGLAD